ncbi:uncharacterized protein KY384_007966 [Bacidia gigantensis]|uniref:uncharacterized protein n=1 Tax=Bacidia gigantensis TaxID=2732470 RepID=UPI001D0582A8|nr:uncharacterized protein KY384_007966 [Bacidia gigantensis]KAG8527812.1 hypothetical protein KY384_007966 [Bacidia gigantensis]
MKQRQAKRDGLVKLRNSGRNWKQSLVFYYHEFDHVLAGCGGKMLIKAGSPIVLGVLILVAGFALFLLPFGIATYQADKWASASTITMIVLGGVLLLIFPVYEKYISRQGFVPFSLLTDRTVIGACLNAATLFVSF